MSLGSNYWTPHSFCTQCGDLVSNDLHKVLIGVCTERCAEKAGITKAQGVYAGAVYGRLLEYWNGFYRSIRKGEWS